MLSTSRCVGGLVRPRRGSGHQLEKLKVIQPLTPDANAHSAQWPLHTQHTFAVDQGAEGRTALLCEISAAPLNTDAHRLGNIKPQSTSVSHINTSLCPRSAHPPSASQQTRGFHTSPHVPYDSTSYNVTDVPDFFVKYKQQRVTFATRSEHKHELLGLMPTLTDSVLSGDVVANTRRLKAKIPVEHHVPEGHIIHPSGFVVPGPGHTSTSDVARAKERERNENKDRAVQTAAVAHRVRESDFEEVAATTLPSQHKVPFEVREPDGTVKHPSGFVPPTPAHKFRYTVNSSVLRDHKVSDTRQRARQSSPPRAVLRAMHTTATSTVSGDVE